MAQQEWTVTMPGVPPTLNRMLAGSLRRRVSEKRQWRDGTYYATLAAGVPHLRRARVVFTRHAPRECDDDNLIASFKHVRDGLVRAGVVRDDDAAYLQATYRQERCEPDQARIELRIAPIAEAVA